MALVETKCWQKSCRTPPAPLAPGLFARPPPLPPPPPSGGGIGGAAPNAAAVRGMPPGMPPPSIGPAAMYMPGAGARRRLWE